LLRYRLEPRQWFATEVEEIFEAQPEPAEN